MIELTHNPNIVYDVDYFIAKFSAIPEDRWCTGGFTKHLNHGVQHCMYGHCVKKAEYFGELGELIEEGEEPEAAALMKLFKSHFGIKGWQINDDPWDIYTQPTPKQRILAALNDIKLKQQQINK